MRQHLLIGSLLTVFLIGSFFIFNAMPRWFDTDSSRRSLSVGGEVFEIDVAETPLTRAQGLSDRETLAKNDGMLFIFDSADYQGFWMKDMKFPIDIIWIKGDRVVGWQEAAPPDDDPNRAVYYSPEPVDKVLEVSSGAVARLGLRIDDIIKF